MLNTRRWNGRLDDRQQSRWPAAARLSAHRLIETPKASDSVCRKTGSKGGAEGWWISSRLPRTPVRPALRSRPSERNFRVSRLDAARADSAFISGSPGAGFARIVRPRRRAACALDPEGYRNA